MALPEKGRYYELPLEGSKIHTITYSGVLRLFFDRANDCYLDLLGEFRLEQYGKSSSLSPASKEALLLFYDLLKLTTLVKTAKADKEGRLYLTVDNELALTMDKPSECWQFTRTSGRRSPNNVSASGGLGYLDF